MGVGTWEWVHGSGYMGKDTRARVVRGTLRERDRNKATKGEATNSQHVVIARWHSCIRSHAQGLDHDDRQGKNLNSEKHASTSDQRHIAKQAPPSRHPLILRD
eukprot:69025-Pleurochrysis_carterae.AAC.1